MAYNSNIHHRRSIRFKGYDYSQAGLYFITICCKDRMCRFGKIENNEMVLNLYGKIAYYEWAKLPERFANFELDVFQIMPNHMHGIIVLNGVVGATLAVAPDSDAPDTVAHDMDAVVHEMGVGASPSPTTTMPPPLVGTASIGDIVGAYKSLVANECLEIFKSNNETMGKLWQRNYHEHIIRNEQSYQTISNYIITNPAKWDSDKFYNL